MLPSSNQSTSSTPLIQVQNYKIPYWGVGGSSQDLDVDSTSSSTNNTIGSSSSSSDQPPQIPTTHPQHSQVKFPYYLEVIKEGELLEDENIDISKQSYYVFGRQQDMSHVLCANNSISRQHCLIQHAKNGRVYLYDLGSANGTFWNNRKHQCKPHRFIPLWLGNSFTLGMSSRSYVLSVKEGYEDSVRKLEEDLRKRKTLFEIKSEKKKKNASTEKKRKNYDSEGEEISEDELPEDYDENEDNRNKRLRIEDQLTKIDEFIKFIIHHGYEKPSTLEGLVEKQEQLKLHLTNLKKELETEIQMIQDQQQQQHSNTSNEGEEEDEFEKYMNSINSSLISQNTEKQKQLEKEIKELEEELSKIQDAITKAKPSTQSAKDRKQFERDAEIMRDRLTRDMFLKQSSPQSDSVNSGTSNKVD
ncbi:hypothetical protein C9374_010439 [Naegleria lovaniensis]|uniref:FHA domain-containing protein n=1 Tax=Naegleria lovaniensis TaxID=51637 RepID=A0AA88GFU2_NAELO|nr:uncharacterized protein C9374_010439 [Naegleria lovaniensis]KAG2374695.1 hypothetical protein C9374_010439 [Naegleria lovaniensis]